MDHTAHDAPRGDIRDVADFGVAALCVEIAETQDRLRQVEADELRLIALWAELHDEHTVVPGSVLPGTQRAKWFGGDGTPLVAEFSPAELAVLLRTSVTTAEGRVRDALDLRHRHPLLWAAVVDQHTVRAWQARWITRAVTRAGLSLSQARWVDEQVTPYVATLAWSQVMTLVDAKIVAADPRGAEARRQAAELAMFVTTGRSNEHGLRTLVARARAGDVVYLVAMLDRIAHLLAVDGDDSPLAVRRSSALGILGNPVQALALLERHTPDSPPSDLPPRADGDGPDLVLQSELHPSEVDADDLHEDPGLRPTPCPTCRGAGEVATGRMHHGPGGVLRRPPDGPRLDRLRNRAVLYVHVSEQDLRALSRAGAGVARVEDVGPVTVEQAREWLRHARVTVVPVRHAGQAPAVNGYEVPGRTREAMYLRNPSSAFPWSASTSRRVDSPASRPMADGRSTNRCPASTSGAARTDGGPGSTRAALVRWAGPDRRRSARSSSG